MKSIGVFTSGGDAPGMNACIRAVQEGRSPIHLSVELRVQEDKKVEVALAIPATKGGLCDKQPGVHHTIGYPLRYELAVRTRSWQGTLAGPT